MLHPADDPASPSPEISVVVPLYNEEDNVVPLQEELATALQGIEYEVVLVDDGSTDGTAAKVVPGERVRLLEFEANTGQSAAMHAGIQAARGEIIVLIDGDLQNDPRDIPQLLEPLRQNEADLACGYRAKRKDTAFKRLQSRIANGVRSRFVGDGVRDTGCTLKAMRQECRRALPPFTGMHRFIPALIKGAGFRIVEMAVNHRPRQHGESKYGFGNRAWKATMDMFGVRWLVSRSFHYQVKGESD
ncbi:MAG: glycosyltransferase family 2 protein [Verrucomicrobiota bacterium]